MKIKTNTLVITSATLSTFVLIAYATNFHDSPISNLPENWGTFGDYLGGTLNPILGFISILLVTNSLNIQAESHSLSLKQQERFLEEQRNSQLRCVEDTLINFCRPLSEITDFQITIPTKNEGDKVIKGRKAVIALENIIERMEEGGSTKDEISKTIETLDNEDCMFEVCRRFLICIKIIEQSLSDKKGFDKNERTTQAVRIIGLTNFHKIRSLIASMNYTESTVVTGLKESTILADAFAKVNLTNALFHLAQEQNESRSAQEPD